jgi:hypothetical protein
MSAFSLDSRSSRTQLRGKHFSSPGIRGRNDQGEDVFSVHFEWPNPYLVREAAVAKRVTENLHLNRFITDLAIGAGFAPFASITEGRSERPDFICETVQGQASINLDCTQLTLPTRRSANALFEHLRKALLDQPRTRFAKLRGCSIYAWFEGEDGKLSLPFREADDDSALKLASALSEYSPRPVLLSSSEMPTTAPHLSIVETAGCRFYAVAMADAVPTTDFFAKTGFELGLAYKSYHSRQTLLHELQRVVSKHDKPKINVLLVTAGGPDHAGFAHVSEHVLAQFLLEAKIQLAKTKHLSQVFIHLWHTGAIIQVVPDYRVICGDLYPAGISVPSHQMANSDTATAAATQTSPPESPR